MEFLGKREKRASTGYTLNVEKGRETMNCCCGFAGLALVKMTVPW